MKERDLFLAAYDICAAERLRRALDAVKGFAVGGQKSVFECYLSAGERAELLGRMGGIIDPAQDAFFLLRLDPRATVHALGIAVAPLDPPFFYQG